MDNQQKSVKVIGVSGLCASAIKKTNMIAFIDKAIPKKSHLVRLTHGHAAATIVLNFLSAKSYCGISNIERFAEEYAVSPLIGSLETPDAYSPSTIGDTLDAIYDYGPARLFTEFVAQSVNCDDVTIGHLDSTSFHVHRHEMEVLYPDGFVGPIRPARPIRMYSEDEQVTRFSYGRAKDKRDDLPQINVMGVAARVPNLEKAIPIYTSTFDGNINDIRKMREFADKDMAQLHELYPNLKMLVADSAAATPETIAALVNQGIAIVSRLSDSRKESKRAMQAFESASKTDKETTVSSDGQQVELFFAGECTFTDPKGTSVTGRLIVVQAQTLRESKERTINRKAEKELQKLQKDLDKLARRPAACRKDAERSFKECTKKLKYCSVTTPVYEENYGYDKPGKPKAGAEKKVISCSVKAQASIDIKLVEEAVKKELLYVLFAVNTNVSAKEIYDIYHQQNDIETVWRDMKNKELCVPNFFVKKPERIQALICLVSMAIYISRIVENAVFKAFRRHGITFRRTSGRESLRPHFSSISAVLRDTYISYSNGIADVYYNEHDIQGELLVSMLDKDMQEFYLGDTFIPYLEAYQPHLGLELMESKLPWALRRNLYLYRGRKVSSNRDITTQN